MINPKQFEHISATDVLQMILSQLTKDSVEGMTKDRKDGNALLKYEVATSERGRNQTVFYWVVANPLPPRHTRVASFSYTILAEQRNQREIQRELEMLESEIEAATFSMELGVAAE